MRANLQVEFADGLRAYGLFDATIDKCIPMLFPTQDAAWNKYYSADGLGAARKEMNAAVCACKHDEPVTLTTWFGDEPESWPGRACRTCMAVTDGFESP